MRGFPFDSQIVGTDDAGLPIYDRASDSEQLADLIKSFFTSGILGTGGFNIAKTGTLAYAISPGKALVNGRYCVLDTPQTITTAGGGAAPRIDTVVLRCDLSLDVRGFVLDVVTGTPAASPVAPALRRDDIVWEMGLYNFRVAANASDIPISSVEDTRLDNARCGYVVEAMEDFDTTQFYNQIQADLADFRVKNKAAFDEWFADVQTTLDGDVAGNLLNRINSKASAVAVSALIPAASWTTVDDVNISGSVYVPGVTADNVVIATPDPISHSEYATCGVRAVQQSADSLVFNADSVPEYDLMVNVLVMDLGVS